MADNKFFTKFPIIEYKRTTARNIMRRVAISNSVRDFINQFYTYTATREDTIDTLAYNYYDDVNYDWLIYLANDMIDPYYDVWLDDDTFRKYIVEKYGSIRNAQRKVAYYINDWENDFRTLTTASYAALSQGERKYWHPIDNGSYIVGYDRAKVNFRHSTNKIISYEFVGETSPVLEAGEIAYIDNNTSQRATVAWANSTFVVLKDIDGTFAQGGYFNLTGETSTASANVNAGTYTNQINFTDSDNLLVQNTIPAGEEVYFRIVTAYDEEVELNTLKREIYLVDNENKSTLNKQLREILD